MTVLRSRLTVAAAAIGLATVLLAGCSGNAAPPATDVPRTDAPTTAPTAPAAGPTPSVSPVDATCDSIIVDDLRAQFTAQKWTAKKTPFAAGGVTLDDGLLCTWGNPNVASGMLYGWAPITSDQAAQMQRGLEAKGWIRKEQSGTVYITEDPTQAPSLDENGFGMTYQFGDGWVIVADLKQGLLLIQRPQS